MEFAFSSRSAAAAGDKNPTLNTHPSISLLLELGSWVTGSLICSLIASTMRMSWPI
jgi:hypothetical protein